MAKSGLKSSRSTDPDRHTSSADSSADDNSLRRDGKGTDQIMKEKVEDVNQQQTTEGNPYRPEYHSLVFHGITKAFIGEEKFSVKYEEDLDSFLDVFETL